MRAFTIPLALLAFVLCGSEGSEYKNLWYDNDRSVMVHLFEWKWADIAAECERFLAPKGYGGVQVSPPNENVVVMPQRPWWERFQPVSYLLRTRSGNEVSFRDMVERCNNVSVRIYVTTVINHMTNGVGLFGTAGSPANHGDRQYPAVPYTNNNFNKPRCSLRNFSDPIEIRNCEVNHLHDLNHSYEPTVQSILAYMNDLIDMGVAGFIINSANNMWPHELKIIYTRLKDLNRKYFPENARPYIAQEVHDYGDGAVSKNEYIGLGAVTEYKFTSEIGNVFGGLNELKALKTWGPQWDLVPSGDGLNFVDNHDVQRSYGENILSFMRSKQYKGATAFNLAHLYGEPGVMSSFAFEDRDSGPPQDEFGNILSPIINEDDSCGNWWVCEHRWRQIYQMIEFRNIVKGAELTNWWDNNENQIAFCRQGKGFIAFNGGGNLSQILQTCLPTGQYCDIISGRKVDGFCTGKLVHVGADGRAFVSILETDEDMVLAIHTNSRR